jgi:hypothetical protein
MAALSDKLIADGKRFVQALDEAGVVSTAVLWFWSAPANAWHYVVASPLVEPNQDLPVKIAAVMALMPADSAVTRETLRLYPPNAEFIRTLQNLMQTGPGISNIRTTDNFINGVHIEDAYIYRLNRRAA